MAEDAAVPHSINWNHDIRHFFTARDVACMQSRMNLHEYASVKANAAAILGQVKSGNMPPVHSGEQPWSAEKVSIFETWVKAGCPEG
jgi:hypothetical protein